MAQDERRWSITPRELALEDVFFLGGYRLVKSAAGEFKPNLDSIPSSLTPITLGLNPRNADNLRDAASNGPEHERRRPATSLFVEALRFAPIITAAVKGRDLSWIPDEACAVWPGRCQTLGTANRGLAASPDRAGQGSELALRAGWGLWDDGG